MVGLAVSSLILRKRGVSLSLRRSTYIGDAFVSQIDRNHLRVVFSRNLLWFAVMG